MNRRTLIGAGLAAVAAGPGRAAERRVEAAGVRFVWDHRDGRLHGRLQAPTRGWIAVGFSDRPGLAGTRFVMAAVAQAPIAVEEHIALVPDHPRIEALGGRPALADVAGGYAGGASWLGFSLPAVVAPPYPLDLRPGRTSHLMLAWSTAPEFDHHSAWREHFAVVL